MACQATGHLVLLVCENADRLSNAWPAQDETEIPGLGGDAYAKSSAALLELAKMVQVCTACARKAQSSCTTIHGC